MDIIWTIGFIILLILLWMILYDSHRFIVVRHTFADKRIKKPCRAVVLSDLHNKSYGRDNEKLLEAVRENRPDVILIAGDILTAKPGANMSTAIHLIQTLAGEYPVYYGNGNHEHRIKLYQEKYGDMAEQYDTVLQEAGVHLLVNASELLGENGIRVYGAEIDRDYYKRFKVWPMDDEYMDSILGKPDTSNYTVLLAHNPDYFPQYATWGADVTFSGHVHGGIVRIPIWNRGVCSPGVRLFPKYDGGLFQEGSASMIVSRGLGMHTIPIRLFNPGELIVVDFLPE